MPDFLYRFRPLESLLNFNELENQEIFFAESAELNDPIEGYLDVYFQGDKIVWANLFKNYLYCLFSVQLKVAIIGEDLDLKNSDIPVSSSSDSFPLDSLRKVFKAGCEAFFSNSSINKLIECLGSNPVKVRKDELFLYLKCLHPFSMHILSSASGFGFAFPKFGKSEQVVSQLTKIETFALEIRTSGDHERGFEIGRVVEVSHELNRALSDPLFLADSKRRFIGFEFPQRYIDSLQSLMFPQWYAACFTEDIYNTSLWGHYGRGHQGVSLIFKTEPIDGARVGLSFQENIGIGPNGSIVGKKVREFKKVIYETKYPEIDFFPSLGRLTEPHSYKHWYSDDKGNISPSRTKILDGTSRGIEALWAPFHQSSAIKLKEWSYEAEWRLVKNGLLSDKLSVEDRLLKYEFSSLHGIVFGINTPLEAKARIVEIVKKKCVELHRTEFKFSQAIYSHKEGKIDIVELPPFKLAVS